MIGGWKCEELYPGEPWSYRVASRGNVELVADHEGVDLDESSLGHQGGVGRYAIPANVLMWLAQAVR